MIREGLGVARDELAPMLAVAPWVIELWDSDDDEVPERAWEELSDLEDEAEEHVKAGGADPAEWPRGWLRAVKWRIHCAERANRD